MRCRRTVEAGPTHPSGRDALLAVLLLALTLPVLGAVAPGAGGQTGVIRDNVRSKDVRYVPG